MAEIVPRSSSVDNSGLASTIAYCPWCGGGNVVKWSVGYPQFRHLDFDTLEAGAWSVGCCDSCQAVFRIASPNAVAMIDAMYQDARYATLPQPRTVLVDGKDERVPSHAVQAKILDSYMPTLGGGVLDIGCLDGALLREIASRRPDLDLCGFDVADRLDFPSGKPFRFVEPTLDRVEGEFGLIVLSQSLQYIRDFEKLFRNIGRLLAADGVVYVQVPDLRRKPCSLLLGDQHYCFTPSSLANVFGRFGFALQEVEEYGFPRDIVALARRSRHCKIVANGDDPVDAALRRLEDIRKGLAALDVGQGIAVFGTTIEAAFIDETTADQVVYFVDEDPGKVDTLFRGRAVRHPDAVGIADVIVIPWSYQGEALRARLAASYPGTFVTI